MSADRFDAVVSLAHRRGFVFPSGEIYGGEPFAWDYGPLGVELKEHLRRQWWRTMVQHRDDVVGLDSAVLQARAVIAASGMLDAHTRTSARCRSCDSAQPLDGMVGAYTRQAGRPPAALTELTCPNCASRGSFTDPDQVSGLLGASNARRTAAEYPYYLRPEAATGTFVNFANVMIAARKKPPFGIAQAGRSFRHFAGPGEFLLASRELERMELEYFVEPGADDEWLEYWVQQRWDWYVDLGLAPDRLRRREPSTSALPQHAKRLVEIEYRFGGAGPEFVALEGVTNRADHDLTVHAKHSGADLSYFDQDRGERWVPYAIEPAANLTVAVFAFLLAAYDEDEAPNTKGGVDKRTVLRFDPRLAPVKVAVLPLSRNSDLSPKARDLSVALRRRWVVEFDDSQAIGRRYRRQDEIGTPYCVTVDFGTLADDAVTVRDRDTMAQQRVALDQVERYLLERLPTG
ncbi:MULTISPECIES: glycine--tRNA ligase [unclassified Solwaraspora]|uniref:glycine--tRNA ligase n=1 Tax=unclassified Solwaraspora TaxID=2627926 RepID=UPI00259B1D0F|nr:glycine--tRNA ligase [Solwaraspora sp. WMMA2056]WJK43396.1 glycine--tRNA ligase [Solwaraspora sp. WMMA2056]